MPTESKAKPAGSATLTYGNKSYSLPVYGGSQGPNVVDVRTGEILTGVTVVVRDGMIVSVGTERPPRGVEPILHLDPECVGDAVERPVERRGRSVPGLRVRQPRCRHRDGGKERTAQQPDEWHVAAPRLLREASERSRPH